MKLEHDEVMMAFERPTTLFDWVNTKKNILTESNLPLLAKIYVRSGFMKGDRYPIDDGFLPLCNVVALTHLDMDAFMRDITSNKFSKALGQKEFKDWYCDLELESDPKKINHDLRRECFRIFHHLPALEKVMEALKAISKAMFTEYMITQERALWFNGSSNPVFTGERVMIEHWPK